MRFFATFGAPKKSGIARLSGVFTTAMLANFGKPLRKPLGEIFVGRGKIGHPAILGDVRQGGCSSRIAFRKAKTSPWVAFSWGRGAEHINRLSV